MRLDGGPSVIKLHLTGIIFLYLLDQSHPSVALGLPFIHTLTHPAYVFEVPVISKFTMYHVFSYYLSYYYALLRMCNNMHIMHYFYAFVSCIFLLPFLLLRIIMHIRICNNTHIMHYFYAFSLSFLSLCMCNNMHIPHYYYYALLLSISLLCIFYLSYHSVIILCCSTADDMVIGGVGGSS